VSRYHLERGKAGVGTTVKAWLIWTPDYTRLLGRFRTKGEALAAARDHAAGSARP
jgi:hypothetical protein